MNQAIPIPSTTPAAPVPLSITVATLPPDELLHVYELPHPAGHVHYLLVLPEGITLDRAVRSLRHLSGTDRSPRAHTFAALGVPDPDTDPTGHHAARWWAPGQTFDLGVVADMERAGRLTAWPHNGEFLAVTR